MNQPLANPQAAAIAEKVRASGTSFYAAMRLLPEPRRDAMFAIYAFCREVDDIAYYEVLAKWKLGVVLEQGFQRAGDDIKLQAFGPVVLDLMRETARQLRAHATFNDRILDELDIAGVDTYEREKGVTVKGASGIPVRTLVHLAEQSAPEHVPPK